MPRLFFRIAMFLSSFSPRFALMAYENHEEPVALYTLLSACVIGVCCLYTVMRQLTDEKGPRIEIRDSAPKDGEVLAYIAVYLLPFLSIDLSHRKGAIVFAAFLVILCLVYVNSNMLFVNPLLNVFGYHSFEVTDTRAHTYTLIIRARGLDGGTIIRPAQVDRYLRVDAHWRPMRNRESNQNP
ncbi:MAG TPA: hypothetical protein VKA53_01670 [Thermoanaerobaculia bacterium]|nr:hypothetical protein [Thermoanaerobaculia bacterium]